MRSDNKSEFFLQTEISCLALLGCEMTNIWARKRKKKGKNAPHFSLFFPLSPLCPVISNEAERSKRSLYRTTTLTLFPSTTTKYTPALRFAFAIF